MSAAATTRSSIPLGGSRRPRKPTLGCGNGQGSGSTGPVGSLHRVQDHLDASVADSGRGGPADRDHPGRTAAGKVEQSSAGTGLDDLPQVQQDRAATGAGSKYGGEMSGQGVGMDDAGPFPAHEPPQPVRAAEHLPPVADQLDHGVAPRPPGHPGVRGKPCDADADTGFAGRLGETTLRAGQHRGPPLIGSWRSSWSRLRSPPPRIGEPETSRTTRGRATLTRRWRRAAGDVPPVAGRTPARARSLRACASGRGPRRPRTPFRLQRARRAHAWDGRRWRRRARPR